MKKKLLFPVLLLTCLLGKTAYAAPVSESVTTESVELTEENRYDPVYYQEPEEIYPSTGSSKPRSAKAGVPLEECLVNAWETFQAEVDVSAYNIPVGEASEKYFQILNSHPSIFYVKSEVVYSYSSNGMVMRYHITYTDTQENVSAQKAVFDQEVQRALNCVDPSMTEVEKALVVHDYLVLECEYDYERLQSGTVPDISHSAYGALVDKIAVCDGYSKAYGSILDQLGIESTLVASDAMNHAWNLVSLGSKWYHVDATWDDPTWDNVGRVGHNYFLLSDTAISDSGHKHTGWDNHGITAVSTLYDNAFWSEVSSAFCYQQGDWYYAKYDKGSRETSLVKKPGLLEGQEEIAYKEGGTWNNYINSFMYLDLAKDGLYFNTRTDIRRLEDDGTATVVYEPGMAEENLIFGFTVKEENSGMQLCYALQETPNLTAKQVVDSYTMQEITGIAIDGLKFVYDGQPKQITVQGVKEGDSITYRVDGKYQAEQPEMKDAGTYEVSYKIGRTGYVGFVGTAQVVIEKATPTYVVPEGLKGSSGSKLSEVELPAGFSWEPDGAAKLSKEGKNTYYVSYTPEDTKNYKVVSKISVEVAVSCPGHQYESKVTVEPTTTQKGEETYTCKLCGNSYTNELEKLPAGGNGNTGDTGSGDTGNTGGSGSTGGAGDIQGGDGNDGAGSVQAPKKASGLKVSKASNNSLKFTWKKVQGVKYKLVLYKGTAKISTKNTDSNSYTFKKLKSATYYTLEVTPYVQSKKGNVYASGNTTIQAVTAPEKAKLTSVKKNGKNKVKVTWKKVAKADGYEVSMRTGKGSYKVVQKFSKGKVTNFTKSGLKRGKSYSFRVRAYKKLGNRQVFGSYSNVKSIKIK